MKYPLLAAALTLGPAPLFASTDPKPNVVILYADDLGFGDLGCYGATKIQTPRMDALAAQGVRFTDAHAAAAVCNPSRYALLTGTHLWNARRKNDYSLYFHDGQVTLPGLLKSAGYSTAAFGKWHNGFGREPEPDWNGELKPGPLEIGFEKYFGTPRSHNEPPFVFVEDYRVVGLDPADPIVVDRSAGVHGSVTGGKSAEAARPDEQIDLIVTDRAVKWISEQKPERPFFLYLAFTAPHVPLDPAPQYRGKSGAGIYGDFVQQLDDCVGKVLDALDEAGVSQNTLVILSSDNGGVFHCEPLTAGHRSNGPLLGQKTDMWEGGHRVPFLARWPARIPAGTVRKELFAQIDLMATIAEAAGIPLPSDASPDGVAELAAFTEPESAPPSGRTSALLGVKGKAVRSGDWLFLPYQGSGGMTAPEQKPKPWGLPFATLGLVNSDIDAAGNPKPDAPEVQLYNLKDDPGQTTNVAAAHPDIVEKLSAEFQRLTTPHRARSGATP